MRKVGNKLNDFATQKSDAILCTTNNKSYRKSGAIQSEAPFGINILLKAKHFYVQSRK